MMRRAMFWSYASQISIFFVNFIGTVIIARLLSPREMGVYAIASAIIGILQTFTAFNVGGYLIRKIDLTEGVIDTAFTVNAVLSVVLSALIFICSFFGSIFSDADVIAVVQLLAIIPILSVFSFRASVLLQRAMEFRGTSILAPLGSIVSIGVTIYAATHGYSYLSPAFGALASAAFLAVGTLWIGRRYFAVRVSIDGWREITAFGLRLMSIGGLSVAAIRAGEIVIAHFQGLAALGLFNRASNLNNLIYQNLYGTATKVIFVRLSAAQRNDEDIGPIFIRGFRTINSLMGPILIGLSVLASPVILVLYGEQWIDAAPLLSIILVAQFLALAFAMNWELFVVRNELRVQTRFEVARSIMGITTTTIASSISLVAVAWSTIVDTIFSLFLYGRSMPKLIGTTQRTMFKIYGEVLALTSSAVLPAVLAMSIYHWTPYTPIPVIVAAIAMGIALWVGCLILLKHPLLDEVKFLMHRRV